MVGFWLSWCTPGGETLRSLTLAEHAALQTFPTDYQFPEHRATAHTLCGNAVPPKFAEMLMSNYRLPVERGELAVAVFPEAPGVLPEQSVEAHGVETKPAPEVSADHPLSPSLLLEQM